MNTLVSMPTTAVNIAVAIIQNSKNPDLVLISKRHTDAHLGGLWEFPGGKVEDGESTIDALHREVEEEIGLVFTNAELFESLNFDYPDKKLFLSFYLIINYQGQALGREKQEVRWVKKQELKDFPFPEANTSVIEALIISS